MGRASGPLSCGYRRSAIATAALAAIGLLVVVSSIGGHFAIREAVNDLRKQAHAALPLAMAALTSEIEKQRVIPLTLARDPTIIEMLRFHSVPTEHDLNRKLRAIAEDARATVIYLIDIKGRAIAASNAGEQTSFVGSDYQFRRYFQDAMTNGSAIQYSLGTVSGRPGLYLSRRVDGPEGPFGVIVIKTELNDIEANWRASGFLVLVTNKAGVILATSVPSWHFKTLSVLPEAVTISARDRLQVGERQLQPISLSWQSNGQISAKIEDRAAEFVSASGPMNLVETDWAITLLVPAEAALLEAARRGQLITLLSLLLTAAMIVALWHRRKIVKSRQAELFRINTDLERSVASRTIELVSANDALAAQISEREIAEGQARKLRDELAQANRLSILGQIAAGVTHEMNQPLAAIRIYADNAKRLIADDKKELASANLDSILGLTDRISVTSETLRSFARRGSGKIGPVSVEDAIVGAISLLSGRIKDARVRINWERQDRPLTVLASRIQLEQILVNLLQNALDAVKGQPKPLIDILLEETQETIRLSLQDNGSGLAPEIRANLFMPFTTNKEKGLGLGLVISSDIAREFGGALMLDSRCEENTRFTLELRRQV